MTDRPDLGDEANLFDALDAQGLDEDVPAPGQFRLSRLQVTNWGTFCGHHSIDVPRAGLLLTGESGSGKSSLLDAMSAIMIAPQDAHFNSAATDSQTGDDQRTLMSYVRGAHRNYTDDDTQEIRTSYLRTGPTCAGISMTWENGIGGVVSAVRLFHVKGASRAAQDLRSIYALTSDPVELPDWIGVVLSGIDKKRLKAAFPEGVFFDSYSAFGPQLRKRTGIGRETAQKLLHKALSAKSMRSLDQLLRSFMLDQPSTFEAADHAVSEFDDLNQAHEAVVDARDQVEVLRPLHGFWARRTDLIDEIAKREADREGLPAFRARIILTDIGEQLARARTELAAREAEQQEAEARAREDLEARDRARADLMQRGGADIDRALRERDEALEQLAHTESLASGFLSRLSRIEEAPAVPSSRAEFAQVIEQVKHVRERLATERGSQAFEEAIAQRDRARAALAELEKDTRARQEGRSRIDRKLTERRDQIARALEVPSSMLPFAGELMDVAEIEWQGAIERLMSGFARTLLIAPEIFEDARRFIDATHLGIRLVFQCPEEGNQEVPSTDPRSAARKLRVAPGRFEQWIRREVAVRFPHVCVLDADELDRFDRAVTIRGTVKAGRRFTKDDTTPINDRTKWSIGTSNDDLLDELLGRARAARESLQAAESVVKRLYAQDKERVERISELKVLEETSWETIDVEGRRRALKLAEQRITDLETANSEVPILRQRLEELTKRAESSQATEKIATTNVGRAQSRVSDLEGREARARSDLNEASVDPEVEGRLRERTTHLKRHIDADSVTTVTDQIGAILSRELDDAHKEFAGLDRRISNAQLTYASRWPGKVANLVPDTPASAPDFLAVLEQLQTDRLPEFEGRFRRLLAEQSQNNLGRIREEIASSLAHVRKSIEPANASLALTPFDRRRDRYLRIEPSPRISSEVRAFTDDLNRITSGAFNSAAESSAQAEQRFLLMKQVLERLGSADPADRRWRDRVLDTRAHVSFRAIEHDSQGVQTDVYEGSGGRSGGQSQKLVTFCLVAALRYQLADVGREIPRYGTVALDEAFDKTDAEFTEAGLAVFDQFRFQLLLATPLKMLQTIARHVGGAVTVSNPTGDASRLSSISFTRVTPIDEDGADSRTEERP